MIKGLFFLLLITIFGSSEDKTYVKNYYSNGKLESEGWFSKKEKINYWFFYYENGKKKEEGHYIANNKEKWWLFYDTNGQLLRKTEFKKNKPNGLSILYKNEIIYKAEKYKMGIKTNEWISLADYQKDNPE